MNRMSIVIAITWVLCLLTGCRSGARELDQAYAKDLQKTFMEIMKEKDIQQATFDFLNKIPVNTRDWGGRTALHWAAYYGRKDVIELLLELSADVEVKTEEGDTPIRWAVNTHKYECVRILANHGASLDAPSAAIIGSVGDMKKLVKEDALRPFDYFETDGSDTTCLMELAVMNGQPAMIDFLANSASDVNTRSPDGGFTMLHYAAGAGQLASMNALIHRGVRVNAASKYGWTAIQSAASNGHPKAVELLRTHGATYDVFCAAALGDLKALERFWKDDPNSVNLLHECGYNVLNFAIIEERVQAAKWLLDHGVNAIEKDCSEDSSLPIAVKTGNLDMVNVLLDKDMKIATTDSEGDDPLVTAVRIGNLDMVRLLVERGANVDGDSVNLSGRTPLIQAIRYKHVDIANLLLEHGADPNKASNATTPLERAVEEDSLDMVKRLLAKGAKTTRGHGWSGIFDAVGNGNVEMVKLLLANGADINATKEGGFEGILTPFGQAIMKGKPKMVQFLLSKGVDVHAKHNRWHNLFIAFYRASYDRRKGDPYLEIAKILLKNGYSVNSKATDGRTVLHYAAMRSYDVDCVKWLIAHGANPNAKSNDGSTPLHLLGHSGEILGLLIKSGADVNATNNAGETPLDNLCDRFIFGKAYILEFANELVANGATVDFATACHLGDVKRMKSFLDDDPTLIKTNPIANAAYSGNPKAIQLLIDRGAAVDMAEGADGWTPIHVAAFAGYLEVVKLLVKNGAGVKSKTKTGDTALGWAQDNNHKEVVNYLIGVGAETMEPERHVESPDPLDQ